MFALAGTAPLHAQTRAPVSLATVAPQLTRQLPIATPAPMLAQSVLPDSVAALLASSSVAAADGHAAVTRSAATTGDTRDALPDDDAGDLRQSLIDLAMDLRHIRYVRGGDSPSTGFDCSGFVRYVFAHALGLHLPTNSASQYRSGLKVKRADMQPGDLVFFRTAGRRGHGRVSHVGIYIADGKFIHSPTTGSSVRVDSLDNSYWALRFAGAKRPEALAQIDVAERNS